MNYLVDPQTLIFNSHRVNGFTKMIGDLKIHQWDLLDIAQEVAEEWTSDWPEDEGFGSSDMTYMIKDFIDNVITSIYMKNGIPFFAFSATYSEGYASESRIYFKTDGNVLSMLSRENDGVGGELRGNKTIIKQADKDQLMQAYNTWSNDITMMVR